VPVVSFSVYMREYAHATHTEAAWALPAGMSQRTFLKARAVMMWVHGGEPRLKTAPVILVSLQASSRRGTPEPDPPG